MKCSHYINDCVSQYTISDDERPFLEHGMVWAVENGPEFNLPQGRFDDTRKGRRQRRKEVRKQKRAMRQACRAELKRFHESQCGAEYEFVGLVITAFLSAIFTRIATIIVNYWWEKWGLPE